MQDQLKYKRAFKANDPPKVLSVKVSRSEKCQLREIAAGRSLSFAIVELLCLWRERHHKDL